MRKWIPFLAALLLGCGSPPPSAKPGEAGNGLLARAHLQQASGEVSVKRSAEDDWVAASAGIPLYANDKVRTARGASALLVFEGGSEVKLGPDALISVAETRNQASDLTVLRGKIDAQLDAPGKQSLTVTTPSATVQAGREILFQ